MRFVDGMNGVAFAGNVSRCGPGKSLAALSAENGGRLALDEVLRIADVLLFHVAQAHKRGERVRGLHASSIVRLPDGSLVVEPTSRAHARAPEPASTANEQTDVFELGALLFTLITGHEPEVALKGPLPSLIRALLVPVPGGVVSADPEMPWHVARAIERALHPRRAVRWLDVAELREALFGEEAQRRTLPLGFQTPEWARALMARPETRRAG